jgi:hypothetical protein
MMMKVSIEHRLPHCSAIYNRRDVIVPGVLR